jgi:hypothetical protein
MKHDNLRDATDEKTAQRAELPIPEKTSQRWKTKAHQHREQMKRFSDRCPGGAGIRLKRSSRVDCN